MARITGLNLIASDKTLRAWLDRRAKGTEAARDGKPGAPCKKIRRLNDGGGLVLLDVAGAAPAWRFEYKAHSDKLGRIADKMVSLGTLARVSLESARVLAIVLRDQVAQGVDPSSERAKTREAAKATDTQRKENEARAAKGLAPVGSFEAVAVALHAASIADGAWGDKHAEKFLAVVRRNLQPLCAMHVAKITEGDITPLLDTYIERGQRNTAKNMLDYARHVLKHARKLKMIKHNVAAELDADGYVKRPQNKSHPILKDQARIGELLTAARADSEQITGAAVVAQILLFQRPANTCAMRWADVDLPAGVWRIPADQIKLKKKEQARFEFHIVPLPKQMVALLWELRAITGEAGRNLKHVFVSRTDGRDEPMATETLRGALRRYGFATDEICPHGLRGTAFTSILNHVDATATDAIEANLAHVYGGAQGATYNRADFVEARRPMLQKWANHLDACADGSWAKEQQEKAEAALRALQAEFGQASNIHAFAQAA